MMMKFGLTEEQAKKLADGETVQFTVPDLVSSGRNTTVEMEIATEDGGYVNIVR